MDTESVLSFGDLDDSITSSFNALAGVRVIEKNEGDIRLDESKSPEHVAEVPKSNAHLVTSISKRHRSANNDHETKDPERESKRPRITARDEKDQNQSLDALSKIEMQITTEPAVSPGELETGDPIFKAPLSKRRTTSNGDDDGEFADQSSKNVAPDSSIVEHMPPPIINACEPLASIHVEEPRTNDFKPFIQPPSRRRSRSPSPRSRRRSRSRSRSRSRTRSRTRSRSRSLNRSRKLSRSRSRSSHYNDIKRSPAPHPSQKPNSKHSKSKSREPGRSRSRFRSPDRKQSQSRSRSRSQSRKRRRSRSRSRSRSRTRSPAQTRTRTQTSASRPRVDARRSRAASISSSDSEKSAASFRTSSTRGHKKRKRSRSWQGSDEGRRLRRRFERDRHQFRALNADATSETRAMQMAKANYKARIEAMAASGVRPSDHGASFADVQDEYMRMKGLQKLMIGKKTCFDVLAFACTVIEKMVAFVKPFGVTLNGWSTLVTQNRSTYDVLIEEIYLEKQSIIPDDPLVKLGIALVTSALTVAIGEKAWAAIAGPKPQPPPQPLSSGSAPASAAPKVTPNFFQTVFANKTETITAPELVAYMRNKQGAEPINARPPSDTPFAAPGSSSSQVFAAPAPRNTNPTPAPKPTTTPSPALSPAPSPAPKVTMTTTPAPKPTTPLPRDSLQSAPTLAISPNAPQQSNPSPTPPVPLVSKATPAAVASDQTLIAKTPPVEDASKISGVDPPSPNASNGGRKQVGADLFVNLPAAGSRAKANGSATVVKLVT